MLQAPEFATLFQVIDLDSCGLGTVYADRSYEKTQLSKYSTNYLLVLGIIKVFKINYCSSNSGNSIDLK